MPIQIGERFGEYQLIQPLGTGGFAEVYLGRNVNLLEHEVAIKVLKKNQIDTKVLQFKQEAQTILNFKHPNIVRFITYNIYSNPQITNTFYPYIVMEYAPRGSLRKNHPRNVPLPLAKIALYTSQIAGALQYAHDQQVMHLDVKPENILIGNQGQLLLSDFGLATVVTTQEKKSDVRGTLIYMAPEQISGNPVPASDQYALGIVVYEWICGHVPFTGRTVEDVIDKHCYKEPGSLFHEVPTLPPEVEVVVMRALAKDPQARYPSVSEFAQNLERAINRGNNMGAGASNPFGNNMGANNPFGPGGMGANPNDPFGPGGMGANPNDPFAPGGMGANNQFGAGGPGVGANNPPPFLPGGATSPFLDDPYPTTPGGAGDPYAAPTVPGPGLAQYAAQSPWENNFAYNSPSTAQENSISHVIMQTLAIQPSARRRRYSLLLWAGIIADVIGAIFMGLWFVGQMPSYANEAGWWAFIFCSLISGTLSWLFFASNRKKLNWTLAVVLAFYWGLVGNAFATLIGAGTRISFLPDGSILFVLFLVASFGLHWWLLGRRKA